MRYLWQLFLPQSLSLPKQLSLQQSKNTNKPVAKVLIEFTYRLFKVTAHLGVTHSTSYKLALWRPTTNNPLRYLQLQRALGLIEVLRIPRNIQHFIQCAQPPSWLGLHPT